MNKPVDNAELRRMMDENSAKTTVLSYVMTLVYAVAEPFACMAGREMIESIAIKIIYSMNMINVSMYGGWKRIVQITAIVLMVGIWMSTFMVVWHKIEKAGSLKNRVKVGAVCIGIALAAYLVFCLVQLAAVGYWPTLTGAV